MAGLPTAGVVVLEAADSELPGAIARLQAFDFLGNPAPVFANQAATAALKSEPAGATLLDLAIETKGFMYVLSTSATEAVSTTTASISTAPTARG